MGPILELAREGLSRRVSNCVQVLHQSKKDEKLYAIKVAVYNCGLLWSRGGLV